MKLNYTDVACSGGERRRFKTARRRGRQWKDRNLEMTVKEGILTEVTVLSGPSQKAAAEISANQIFA